MKLLKFKAGISNDSEYVKYGLSQVVKRNLFPFLVQAFCDLSY